MDCSCYRSVTEKKTICEDDGKCAAVWNMKFAPPSTRPNYKALLQSAPTLTGNDWSTDEIVIFLDEWQRWREECRKVLEEEDAV